MAEVARPGGARLRREQRIRRRADFVRIQDEGARVTTRHLLILLSPSSAASDGPARVGVVASRKVGGAVQRNRAKRLVREVFRRRLGRMPAGLDLVVIVRPGTDELGLAELEAELTSAERVLGRRAAECLAPGGARPDGPGGNARRAPRPASK